MISVDGDTSTNDMVSILANGMAENPVIAQENADYDAFCVVPEPGSLALLGVGMIGVLGSGLRRRPKS